MQACKGKTKTGSACRAPAGSGGLCFFHANPDSAKTLGQVGGRKNRRSTVDLQIPENLTATELCKITGNAIRSLLAGELRARDASALAQLCNCLHRIIPGADLEAHVATLEQQVAEKEKGFLSNLASTQDQSDAAASHEPLETETDNLADLDAHSLNGIESRGDETVEAGETWQKLTYRNNPRVSYLTWLKAIKSAKPALWRITVTDGFGRGFERTRVGSWNILTTIYS